MKLLNKLYTYLVIRKSIKIRKDSDFISYRDFLKKHNNFYEWSKTIKQIDINTFAYFLSESDEFSKSPEYYWLESENRIKEMKTIVNRMLDENNDIIFEYEVMLTRKYREKI